MLPSEHLLKGPSALWSVGGSAFETVIDGGRRRAVTQQARDNPCGNRGQLS